MPLSPGTRIWTVQDSSANCCPYDVCSVSKLSTDISIMGNNRFSPLILYMGWLVGYTGETREINKIQINTISCTVKSEVKVSAAKTVMPQVNSIIYYSKVIIHYIQFTGFWIPQRAHPTKISEHPILIKTSIYIQHLFHIYIPKESLAKSMISLSWEICWFLQKIRPNDWSHSLR